VALLEPAQKQAVISLSGDPTKAHILDDFNQNCIKSAAIFRRQNGPFAPEEVQIGHKRQQDLDFMNGVQ
jgi:hypothetical protein